MEPASAVGAAAKIWKFVDDYSQRTTREFEKRRDDIFQEWVAELSYALKLQQQTLTNLDSQLDDLQKRLDDPAYLRAVEILEREAHHEARMERRRMLAFVAAGWVNLDLAPTQLSRVLRAVRELEPEDVMVLRQVQLMLQDAEPSSLLEESEHSPEGVRAHDFLRSNEPCASLLLASNCVTERTSGVETIFGRAVEAHLTPIGGWVLQALDPYVRAYEADIEFAARPIEAMAERLPDGPTKDRLLGYQALADASQRSDSDLG